MKLKEKSNSVLTMLNGLVEIGVEEISIKVDSDTFKDIYMKSKKANPVMYDSDTKAVVGFMIGKEILISK